MRTRMHARTTAGVLLAMAMIALADAQVAQVSLWPLYIGPVVAVGWESDFHDAALASIGSGLLLAVAAGFAGHPFANDLYFLVATMSQVAALLVIGWFASRLAATQSLLLRLLGPEIGSPSR